MPTPETRQGDVDTRVGKKFRGSGREKRPTFKNTFTGILATFLEGDDVDGKTTGITQYGNWTAFPLPSPRTGPYFLAGTPATGAGTSATFNVTVGNTQGSNNLGIVTLLIAPSIVGNAACQAFYFPGNNTLNLINDAGTAFVSPIGNAPGSGGILSNSRCSLNTGASSKGVSTNNLQITFPMSFLPGTFAGAKNAYLNTFDNFGVLTHWVQVGTFNVQ